MLRLFRAVRLSNALLDAVLNNKNVLQTINQNRNQLKCLQIIHRHFSGSVIVTPTSEEPIEEPNISEIVGDDSELEHKLRVIVLETEVLRQEGKPVPNNASFKSAHWKELLILPSKSARRKYLEFLFKIEKTKENRAQKKLEQQLLRNETPKLVTDRNDVLNYNLGGNHFLLRIYETTMNQLHNNRLIQAIQFGQKLVVDCGFYENMSKRENANCAKQLMLMFAENRDSDQPFDLHLCNVNRDSSLIKGLHKYIVTMYEPWFPLNFHEKSYMEVFPKDRLVYLTPDSREVLTKFDHEDVYIVGAIVDKVNHEPLSLAKAKKEGLRMAKLPLDNHLDWGSGGGKSLTLNQVTSILVDVKRTGDWDYALRHVPRRKLAQFTDQVASKKFYNSVFDTRSNFKPKQNFDRLRYSKTSNSDRYTHKSWK